MKNLKVSNKLILSFAVVITFSILVAIVGIWGNTRIKRSIDDILNYNMAAMDSLGQIRENFALHRNTIRELVIYDYSSELYRETEVNLKDIEDKMEVYISEYIPKMRTDECIAIFDEFLVTYYDVYMPYIDDLILRTQTGRSDTVMEIIRVKGKPIINKISDILGEAHLLNVELAKDAIRQNDELSLTMRLIEIVVLAVSITVAITLVIYLTRLIADPLKRIARSLNHMGNTGEMALETTVLEHAEHDSLRMDEIGITAHAIIKLLNHIWNIEKMLCHVSGGDFSIEVHKLSDKDTMGVSVSKVVDNLNDMFNKMKEAEKAANSASKAKGEFLAHMSHEIRTPLNAIMGMTLILNNSLGDREKASASVKQIIASSHYLLSIINDVLDISKIESGKFELNNEPFQLQSALNEVSGIIMQRCSEKKITFITNLEHLDKLSLIGDKMRINQVLINLLGNAVKFTDVSGEIKLLIDVVDETENDVHLKFSVIDNGVGISEDLRTRLFLPFEQGDSAVFTKYGGTGLGLFISYNLVSMMGGTLSVDSKLGVGSTFYFYLRFDKCEYEDIDKQVDIEQINLSGKRILLVEDVDINRLILSELLSPTAVEIEEAENGKRALEMFEKSPQGYYDLIFMDISMPIMDGYEATKNIRKLDRNDAKNISIVAMTANVYREDVERCMEAGMNGHLSKPIEIEELVKTLREYFKPFNN